MQQRPQRNRYRKYTKETPEEDYDKKPEKSGDLTRAKRRALHILERSDRTEQELREKLSKNYLPEVVDAAIEYVKSFHYIDDHRYAVNYLNSRSQGKSSRRLEQELLYKKGISKEVLEAAREEAQPLDERAQIRRWIEKKHIDLATAEQGEIRRFYQFLLRRGYRSADILAELRVEVGSEQLI